MLKINLDGVKDNADDLSENGKAQAASLQFLEAQMNKPIRNICISNSSQFLCCSPKSGTR